MKLERVLGICLLPALLLAQQAAPPGQAGSEMETKEAPAKFTSRVNLVPVTVVVRDNKGHAVGNLTKEDFRLLDNGKPQIITRFSVEKPNTPVAIAKDSGDLPGQPENKEETEAAASTVIANHFVVYLFDDVHVQPEDIMRARDAAAKVIATMQPADRVAIFTTSGQITQDFTSDKAKLQETLARLRPAPVVGGLGHGLDCPDISYFLADRIVNMNDPQAIEVALANYQACSANPNAGATEVAMFAERALHEGEHETKLATSVLVQVIRRLAAMPGQRSLVLASPGFLVPFPDQSDVTDAINRAIRANVVISTLDVRGLWTPPALDVSRPHPAGGPQVATMMYEYLNMEAQSNEFVLQDLALATGGDWFHANNDLADGFRRLAVAPEFIYVLGFTPENLKSDGKFHKLQITLHNPKGLSVQARKGYYAPKHQTNAADQAKQEIEDAVFSRSVVKDIPLTIRTQYFRSGDVDANLSVISQMDIRSLHYRKEQGRNQDVLKVVSAVFDENGNIISGEERTLTLRLKDETLAKRLDSGIRVKSSFPVKIGNYVVRVVVRDSEGEMMASDNAAVDIQ